jgi:hypothetical protein
VQSALASKNLASWTRAEPLARGLDATLLALTAGTAWARLEAEKHFPSDVLAGIAFGNLAGTFLYEAFLGPTDGRSASLELAAFDGRPGLLFRLAF